MAKNQPAQEVNLLGKLFPTFANFLSPKVGKKTASKGFTGKVKPVKASLPMVNLLPPRLELDKMRRSTRRGFMFTALGILVSVGLLWGAQATVIAVANSSLASAKEQVAASTANIEKYSAIKAYFKTIQDRKDILAQKTGAKIDYVFVFKTLNNAMPAGARLSQIDAKALVTPDNTKADMASLIASCGPVTDPFSIETKAQPLSCMTFTGFVTDRNQVAEISRSLKASNLFSNISVVQAAGGSSSSGIAFTGSAVITSNAIVGVAETAASQPAASIPTSTPSATSTPTATATSTPSATSTPTTTSTAGGK